MQTVMEHAHYHQAVRLITISNVMDVQLHVEWQKLHRSLNAITVIIAVHLVVVQLLAEAIVHGVLMHVKMVVPLIVIMNALQLSMESYLQLMKSMAMEMLLYVE